MRLNKAASAPGASFAAASFMRQGGVVVGSVYGVNKVATVGKRVPAAFQRPPRSRGQPLMTRSSLAAATNSSALIAGTSDRWCAAIKKGAAALSWGRRVARKLLIPPP